MQLDRAEIDHVPLTEGGDTDNLQASDPESRGEQLQLAGKPLQKELWKRNHREEVQKRKTQHPNDPPSKNGPAQAHHNKPERQLQERGKGAQFTHNVECETRHYERQAPPGSPWLKRQDLVTLHPDQEQRDERHKETMTIIFIINPYADHECESVIVNHSQQRDAESSDDPPARVPAPGRRRRNIVGCGRQVLRI